MNTCPVDRQVFHLILVRDGCEGVIYRHIPVANRDMPADDEPIPDNTFCEVCGRADREDRLLLCDSCDLGFVIIQLWLQLTHPYDNAPHPFPWNSCGEFQLVIVMTNLHRSVFSEISQTSFMQS